MTTPTLTMPLLNPPPGPIKKKRVLLVDVSEAKRDLRADTMRKLGMEVDCAADISEARLWWRADLYNLVLINMECAEGHRDKFCEDVRGAIPPQQLAFLVGKPGYLANVPNADELVSVEIIPEQAQAATPTDTSEAFPLRWGILEASRRISAVRSLSSARSKSMANRSAPSRDFEIRYSRHTKAAPQAPSEVQKEEMQ